MSGPGIDGMSLRWIQNYRNAKTQDEKTEVQDKDGHSGCSWAWTRSQSNEIDKLGWDRWFKTDGAKGYESFLMRAWST